MNTSIQANIEQLRGQNIIAVQFPNTAELNYRFRQLPGARWSQTLKSWYLPDTAAYRQKFSLPDQPSATMALQDHLLLAIAPCPAGTLPVAIVPDACIHSGNAGVLMQMKEQLILKGYSAGTKKTYLN